MSSRKRMIYFISNRGTFVIFLTLQTGSIVFSLGLFKLFLLLLFKHNWLAAGGKELCRLTIAFSGFVHFNSPIDFDWSYHHTIVGQIFDIYTLMLSFLSPVALKFDCHRPWHLAPPYKHMRSSSDPTLAAPLAKCWAVLLVRLLMTTATPAT